MAAACVHQLVDSFQGQGIQQAAEIALGPELQPCCLILSCSHGGGGQGSQLSICPHQV